MAAPDPEHVVLHEDLTARPGPGTNAYSRKRFECLKRIYGFCGVVQ
jgi:hypothetical protein